MIWLRIIAAAGTLQGAAVLLSVLFRLKHGKNLSLALLITALSLRLALIPVWNIPMLRDHSWLWPLALPLPLLFAPLTLLHMRALSGPVPKPVTALLRYCIPWLTAVVLVSVMITLPEPSGYRSFLETLSSGRSPLSLILLNILIVLCNTISLILVSITAFGKDSRRLSAAKRLWMRSLSAVLFLLLFSLGIMDLLPGTVAALPGGRDTADIFLSLIISLFIFMISSFLMAIPELVNFVESSSALQDSEALEHECRLLVERLEMRMDEGAFRNPDLSLKDLAAEFGVHPNLLSHAVNHYCGVGFRSYLNRKRLDSFETQLLDAADSDRSLLEMAFESGFHSKSTFNRVFREETGLSPSQFAKKKKKA